MDDRHNDKFKDLRSKLPKSKDRAIDKIRYIIQTTFPPEEIAKIGNSMQTIAETALSQIEKGTNEVRSYLSDIEKKYVPSFVEKVRGYFNLSTPTEKVPSYTFQKKDVPTKASVNWRDFAKRGWNYSDDNDWEEFLHGLDVEENHDIAVPHKIELYSDLDVTIKDQVYVDYNSHMNLSDAVFLINANDKMIGCFSMVNCDIQATEDESIHTKHNVLIANAEDIIYDDYNNIHNYFLFCDVRSRKVYKVRIEVALHKIETTPSYLCIDFGTSNTTAGCYLRSDYIKNVPDLSVHNGNVKLDSEGNIVRFEDTDCSEGCYSVHFKDIVPTMIYVNDCSNQEDVQYLFGYDAARAINEDEYCPKASCFMEIKKWISDISKKEEIHDSAGNKAEVERSEIVARYLLFVIRTAENQFKCKFKNLHITAPVKLKSKALRVYSDILAKYNYEVASGNDAIDEGIAVLYNNIHEKINALMKDDHDDVQKKGKMLIIDCGGGTSDLASCEYELEKDSDDIIDLKLTSQHMNGDINFGGNNLTYRIMQYMKIVYAHLYNKSESDPLRRLEVDQLIKPDANTIFSYIEAGSDDDADVKAKYDTLYEKFNKEYEMAEKVIPTRFHEYAGNLGKYHDIVKNNFYFLWNLADEMKKEFYRRTSVSRYTFKTEDDMTDVDLHIKIIEKWRLYVLSDEGNLNEYPEPPKITFTAKEIDKLLRGDIYYLIHRFLNALYNSGKLIEYQTIKLSGQSTKINIFLDSMKEFLPGKMISSDMRHSNDMTPETSAAEDIKLSCLLGAIRFIHDVKERSDIEPNHENMIRHIPMTIYLDNTDSDKNCMFTMGANWEQKASRHALTNNGRSIPIIMKSIDGSVQHFDDFEYESLEYEETTYEMLSECTNNKIDQEATKDLKAERKYLFVYLKEPNDEEWGFYALPLYIDRDGKPHRAKKAVFYSFEADIKQETLFDGKR